MEKQNRPSQTNFVINIAVITFSRLLINTSRRFIYTFAVVFSRGLGVPLTSVTNLIAINQGTAVLGVFLGPLLDYFGSRVMILVGLICLAVGSLAAGLFPFYGLVAVAVFLAGFGKTIVDPAIQSFVGHRVSYHHRGLVIGLMETAWAGSTLVGIPLMGVLIEKLGWQWPFIVIGLLALVCVVIVAVIFPRDRKSGQQSFQWSTAFELLTRIAKNRAALGALLFALFMCVCNDIIFITYSIWLMDSFGLGVIALGVSTTVIGLAELSGDTLTAFLANRIGLKQSVFIGLIILTVSFAMLPFADRNLTVALIALFVVFISFEFSFVTAMSLSTELAPEQRGTMMSAFYSIAGFGHVFGAILGGKLWAIGKLNAVSLTGVCFSLLALLAMIWGIWGWKRDDII